MSLPQLVFEDKGFDTKANLVPYINNEGVKEDRFLRCSTCGDIIPIHELKYDTELEDFVDVESANKPSEFVVVEKRRRYQRNIDNRFQKQDIPKLGNKPDRDLEYMVNQGAVVVNIQDDNVDGEGENSKCHLE